MSEETAAAPAPYIMGLGFDPGWAKSGIGAVYLQNGQLFSAGVELIKTEKNKDKRFEKLRVSMDDERRLRELYHGFCSCIERIKPQVIGIECYTIFESKEYEKLRDAAAGFLAFLGLKKGVPLAFKNALEFIASFKDDNLFIKFLGHLEKLVAAVDAFRVQRGRGSAAKTYGAYSAALCAAYRYGVPAYVFMPIDLKKAACGRSSATKDEVGNALSTRIVGLREKVDLKVRARTLHEHVYDASGHAMLALQEYSRWLRDGVNPQAVT